jgi:hypothetical protein
VGKITGMSTEAKSTSPLEPMFLDFPAPMRAKEEVSVAKIVHVEQWRRLLLWAGLHM